MKIFTVLFLFITILNASSPYAQSGDTITSTNKKREAILLLNPKNLILHTEIEDYINKGELTKAHEKAAMFFNNSKALEKNDINYIFALIDYGETNKMIGNQSLALKYHSEAYSTLSKMAAKYDYELAYVSSYITDTFFKSKKDMSEMSMYAKESYLKYKHYFGETDKRTIQKKMELIFLSATISSDTKQVSLTFNNLEKEIEMALTRYSVEYGLLFCKKAEYFLINGSYKDAEIAINTCLEKIKDKVEIKSDYLLGEIHNLKAKILFGEMDYINSIKEFNIAKTFFERYPQENAKKIAAIYNNLSILYKNLKDYDLAQINIQKAIELNTIIFSENSNEVAENYNNLSGIYNDKGDFNLTYDTLNKLIIINSSLKGEYHEDTLKLKEKARVVKSKI